MLNMEEEKKKFSQMENVLNKINQKYISLPEDEKKRNSKILEQATERLTTLMKEKDILFRTIYERRFYGGSYYDGIKVGKPEEYDLDFVLNLPLIIEPELEASAKPGFVQVRIKEYMKMLKREEAPKYAKLDTLIDAGNCLSTCKVLQWMERILSLAVNELTIGPEGYLLNITLSDSESIPVYATVIKAYPAFTLILKNKDESINLGIDLVPCFQFTEEKWPKQKDGYTVNPVPEKKKFLIVPKKPYGMEESPMVARYWRLSFQEQERELIKGHEFKSMKPAIKLLKKLRDKQNHVKIASYYIKTIFLWEAVSKPKEFWKQSLSYVFMVMLKVYADRIQNRNIPYFWNEQYNLIGHLKEATIKDIGNTLRNIIQDVENHLSDPFVIPRYLIEPNQLEALRSEVDIGKRNLKKLKHSQSLNVSSSLSPATSDNNDSTSSMSEEERIKRVVFNEGFLQEVANYVAKYPWSKVGDIQQTSDTSMGTITNADQEKNDLNKEILKHLEVMHGKINEVMHNTEYLSEKISSLECKVEELRTENGMLRSELNKVIAVKGAVDKNGLRSRFPHLSTFDETFSNVDRLRNLSTNRYMRSYDGPHDSCI